MWVAICRSNEVDLTLAVSNGCPTNTPAAPTKIWMNKTSITVISIFSWYTSVPNVLVHKTMNKHQFSQKTWILLISEQRLLVGVIVDYLLYKLLGWVSE